MQRWWWVEEDQEGAGVSVGFHVVRLVLGRGNAFCENEG